MRIVRLIATGVFVVIVGVIGAGAALLLDAARAPLPQLNGNVVVTGITAQVQVLRDEYGVPHIYGSSLYDLFFAQGYTHAQDRWWQMDVFRHIARGSLQELVGARETLQGMDVFMRTLLLKVGAESEYRQMSDEAKALIDAFSDGVNAYISGRAPNALAMEYRLLSAAGVSVEIEPWSALDSIMWSKVIAWIFTSDYANELVRELMIETLNADMLADYAPPHPFGVPEPIPTQAFERSAGDDASRLIMAGGVRAGEELAPLGLTGGRMIGSAWAAGGDTVDGGGALLANALNFPPLIPSIWTEIGLHCLPITEDCPLDVVGFTFSPMPGVFVGHNGRIAWGITGSSGDTQDTMRMRVNPDNPLEYELDGGWSAVDRSSETIQYGDGTPPQSYPIRSVLFGPILNDNRGEPGFNTVDPLAVNWWMSCYSTQIWEAMLAVNLATDWKSFGDALRNRHLPALNFIYADTAGNIGYRMAYPMPIRPADQDGRTPGDGSTDRCCSYIPHDMLPMVYNPPEGVLFMANQPPVPVSYFDQVRIDGEDSYYTFGSNFDYGYRAARIENLLSELRPLSAESFRVMQRDTYSRADAAILPYVGGLFIQDPVLAEIRDWLRAYGSAQTADDGRAALFAAFLRHLLLNTFSDQLPDGVPITDDQIYAIELLLEQPDNRWWDDANTVERVETRDDILIIALAEAYTDVEQRLGSDRAAWRWGDLHPLKFVNAPLGNMGISLGEISVPVIDALFNRGTFPAPGGIGVLNTMSWSIDGGDYRVESIPSFRMVIDLRDLDSSVSINSTGASGHPSGANYDDQIALWLRGEYKPMLFTRRAVEENALHRLILLPAS